MSENTELSDEEILHGTGKGPATGIYYADPKKNRASWWKRKRVVKRLATWGGPYIKPLSMKTLGAKTREQMRQNHTATITRNSRCPCGSGKRFKKCCMGRLWGDGWRVGERRSIISEKTHSPE